jgi:hypothetical protein
MAATYVVKPDRDFTKMVLVVVVVVLVVVMKKSECFLYGTNNT